MVEFYSVHPDESDPVIAPMHVPTSANAQRLTMNSIAIAMLFAALLAGCATAPTSVPQAPAPPPPPINLSGFPLPYRQGYADGCASATGGERKDASRFTADPNYRTGWQDGIALCRKK